MKTTKFRFLLVPLFVLMVFAVGQSAFATPMTLTLSDGSTTVTVLDSDGDGRVTYDGAVGAFWVSVSTGVSKPRIGSAAQPAMHLNVEGDGTGDLTTTLTDYDFTGGGTIGAHVGGTTDGTVDFKAYADGGSPSVTLGPYSTFGFSGTAGSASSITSTPYSLTLVGHIHHDTFGISSYDLDVRVPEPATLVLLGTGLVGLGISKRRKT